MKQLQEIWDDLSKDGFTTDKGDIHSYLPVYEELLSPYRGPDKNILEIGLFNGHSLRLWAKYFLGNVYGVDCSKTPHDGMADLRPMIATGDYNIRILDATDEAQVDLHFKDKKWDVVIEDSNHILESQVQAINIFKNRINKGGLMVVEDIQDIDKTKWIFDAMSGDFTVEVLDRRHIKGRYDDCLVLLKF